MSLQFRTSRIDLSSTISFGGGGGSRGGSDHVTPSPEPESLNPQTPYNTWANHTGEGSFSAPHTPTIAGGGGGGPVRPYEEPEEPIKH